MLDFQLGISSTHTPTPKCPSVKTCPLIGIWGLSAEPASSPSCCGLHRHKVLVLGSCDGWGGADTGALSTLQLRWSAALSLQPTNK